MAGAEPLFCAIDVGTTGARAAVVDLAGERVAEVRRPYATTVPRPGWAEQDARDWAERSVEALAGLPVRLRRRIAGIGLTGQSPSVVPVDRSGRPVGPGLIYRDNRAVAEAAEMRDRLGARAMHELTGHTAEAFHVGPKVLWLRRHAPAIFAQARCFLQPRDLVLHRLTGKLLTDESHANCTLFFDLTGHRWADQVFEAFSIDPGVFPPAVPSATVVDGLPAPVAAETGLRVGIPIVIGAGDSQCVAFGAGVTTTGPLSEMAGASSCLNSAVKVPRRDLRITHYSHIVPGWFTTEVGLNATGASLQWAVSVLGFDGFDDLAAAASAGLRRLARHVDGADACDAAPIFLPYLADGERDDPTARGAFIGLSDRHDRAAVAYAVVEGVAAGVASAVALLHRAGSPVDELRVSGGGARLGVLGQVKADLLGVRVLHLEADASAAGAALLAAGGAGYAVEAADAVRGLLTRARRFEPDPGVLEAVAARRAWFDRVRRATAVHRSSAAEPYLELGSAGRSTDVVSATAEVSAL